MDFFLASIYNDFNTILTIIFVIAVVLFCTIILNSTVMVICDTDKIKTLPRKAILFTIGVFAFLLFLFIILPSQHMLGLYLNVSENPYIKLMSQETTYPCYLKTKNAIIKED